MAGDNGRVVSIGLGIRDFRRIRAWATKEHMTPEQFLSRLIGDERVRRRQRCE